MPKVCGLLNCRERLAGDLLPADWAVIRGLLQVSMRRDYHANQPRYNRLLIRSCSWACSASDIFRGISAENFLAGIFAVETPRETKRDSFYTSACS
jgi:hypothetical protein